MANTLTDFKAAIAIVADNDVVDFKLDNVDYIANASEVRQAMNITKWVTMYATVELNIRAAAGLDHAVIGVITEGDPVQVDDSSQQVVSGIPWYRVHYKGLYGYSDKVYLSPTPPNPIVPFNHKFGLMALMGTGTKRQALIDSAARLAKAGKPYTFMCVLNDVDLANQLSQYVKYVVHRVYVYPSDEVPPYDSTNAFSKGFEYVILHQNQFYGLNKNVRVQISNEQLPNVNDPEWNYGVGKALESLGYRGCLFNDGVGHPEIVDMQHRASYQVTPNQTLFQWMKTNGHWYGIHEYGENPAVWPGNPDPTNVEWFGQRFRILFKGLDNPLIAITECGLYDAISLGIQTPDAMVQYDTAINDRSDVLGFAWWCYMDNAGTWAKSDMAAYLPNVERAIANAS